VGRALVHVVPDVVPLTRAACDISDPKAVRRALDLGVDGVVNAAAFTAVDAAETEVAARDAANRDGPRVLAEQCLLRGLPLVHLSTDYVFDGRLARPYVEGDPVGPVNAYGVSKLAGEAAIQSVGGRYAIVRVSWVFSRWGGSFVHLMARLARERTHLRAVADQWSCPTPAADIASACAVFASGLADGVEPGIWHLCGDEVVSRYDLARAVVSSVPDSIVERLEPVGHEAFPTAAVRPRNTAMACGRLGEVGLVQPRWRDALIGLFAP
jgi:dTDP-4-dehydrorhamnose reductase